MIDLRELRLNNWVYSLEIDDFVQIASIDSEFVSLKDHVTWNYVYADMIDPIPLTEEILLKCGFETSQWDCHSTFRKDICSDGCIVISLEHKYVEIGDLTLDIEIKYLHQLQNLYFAISGKELKIEL